MTLLLITLASLMLAVIMSFVAWRVARDERARSVARVAALAADIDRDAMSPVQAFEWGTPVPDREAAAVPRDERIGELFATTQRDDAPHRRLGPALVLGGLVLAAVVGTLVVSGGSGDATSTAALAPRPLDLLSLRHVQEAGTTTITGLVRNPRDAAPIERVTAVVSFFDRSGAFLSSSRAPLDFVRIRPGEESPFQISVPTPAGVGRYRVSFRLAEGGVLPHVDRREKN
jgi:hypothetical protein